MSIPQARTGSKEESERSLRLLERKENEMSETYTGTPEKKKQKTFSWIQKRLTK